MTQVPTSPRVPTRTATPPAEPDQIARLLERSAAGDDDAFDELFGLLYRELRKLAHRHSRELNRRGATLNTTALVHESYLKLSAGEKPPLRDRVQFFSVVSKAMRHILIDYARRRGAQRRGGGLRRVTLSDDVASGPDPTADALALDAALSRLGQHDPRLEKVVECRVFAGMNVADTAAALGVSGRTVERDWRRARLYLHQLLTPAA